MEYAAEWEGENELNAVRLEVVLELPWRHEDHVEEVLDLRIAHFGLTEYFVNWRCKRVAALCKRDPVHHVRWPRRYYMSDICDIEEQGFSIICMSFPLNLLDFHVKFEGQTLTTESANEPALGQLPP